MRGSDPTRVGLRYDPDPLREDSRLHTVCLLILAAVAITAALIYTRPVMLPLVLAVLLSYLVAPLVDGLQRRFKAPRGVAVGAAFGVVAVGLSLLGMLIGSSLRRLSDRAPMYKARVAEIAARALSILDDVGIDIGQADALNAVRELPLLSMLGGAAGSMVDLVSNGALVLIFVVYLIGGRRSDERREGMMGEVDASIRRYLTTKVAASAATGVLTAALLAAFGLDLAVVFGVLAFLLNFIPSVGSAVATLLPLPVALVQFESTAAVVGVIALPGAVQFAIGNVIEPKLMGEGLDLHPITVLLGLIFWGLVWGVVGMLLATPITAVIRIVLARMEATRPVAEILAGRIPGDA